MAATTVRNCFRGLNLGFLGAASGLGALGNRFLGPMSSWEAPVPSCEVNYRTDVWTNSRPRPGRLLARAHPGFGAMWKRALGSVSSPATLVPSLGGFATGGSLEQFAASARPTTSAGGSGARGLVESLPRKCAYPPGPIPSFGGSSSDRCLDLFSTTARPTTGRPIF